MQYHISTGVIIENFEKKCSCPLCQMEKNVEKDICSELLQDGCMDDDIRKKVNARGFCEKHFTMLYQMPSKLGLSLQMTTRTRTFMKKFILPKNPIAAKKISKSINDELSTCIVCDAVEEGMIPYYKTIAQMYENEKEFRVMLEESNGFCLKHYSKLLEYSSCILFKSKEYLATLFKIEKARMDKSIELLDQFSYHHDYHNASKPLGEAETALPRIKSDYFGKK